MPISKLPSLLRSLTDSRLSFRPVTSPALPARFALLVAVCAITGCGGTATQTNTSSTPLVITTSSLPKGQMESPYSATLAATGGAPPYIWLLTSGTLPAGLSLNPTTGAITGTSTATANATPLTFTLTDSSSPTQTKSVSLTLTISASSISVSLSLKRAALTVTQSLSILPTTNDLAGVNWSVSGSSCSGNTCGTFSSASTLTGVAVT